MSNEISEALRLLADKIENEIPEASTFSYVIGDDSGVNSYGFIGNAESPYDLAIDMHAEAIIAVNAQRKAVIK